MITADVWGAILTLVIAIPAVAALLADQSREPVRNDDEEDPLDY